MRKMIARAAVPCLLGLAMHQPALAENKVKVGLILTLSTPVAANGVHAKNGFDLALKELGGKIGGVPTEVFVADDEAKPEVAVTKVKGLLTRDNVDVVVGPILSSVLGAIIKPLADANTVLISPNAGSSALAGKNCSPLFFSTSYQNDQVHQISGKVAQDRGYKSVYLIAPNYQAGKDSFAGFKSAFKGKIVEESFVPLNTLDYQSELAKIASLSPDAVFAFLPAGMGVNFIKQYSQAGLAGKIPVLSSFTVDEANLPAQGDAALGMLNGSDWAPDLDTPQNKKFVADYVAAYNAVPATYAMQAYDAVMLLNAAVKSLNGDFSNKDAIAPAIRKAKFTSLRGDFKFNRNGFPIQNFYLTKVGKRPDGKFETQIVSKVFSDYQDPYVAECTLKD